MKQEKPFNPGLKLVIYSQITPYFFHRFTLYIYKIAIALQYFSNPILLCCRTAFYPELDEGF